MTRLPTLIPTLTVIVALAGTLEAQPAPARDHDRARAQVEFGIEMAAKGLWREAIFRFERARELDPEYAAAYNNLGVAFEQAGRLDDARAMYERALQLDPERAFIKENFERFQEVHDRAGLPRRAVPAAPPAPPDPKPAGPRQ